MQPTESPAQQLRYKHRSFSQIKQLRSCGFQFKLERLDRAPSRPGAASSAGTAVHSATELIDNLLLSGEHGSPTPLVGAAVTAALEAFEQDLAKEAEHGWTEDQFRSFGFRPKQDVNWYRTVGIPNSVNAYVDWRLNNQDFEIAVVPGFGPAIEVPFNYYIGDQLIHGFIDRIFTSKEHGGYYPIDLKSGKKPATDEQLGLYAQALRKALGWEITWGYYLYELKKGTAKLTAPIRVDHWTDDKLGQVYLPATRLIDLGIYIPNPGDACFICSVSDACPFAQAVV